MRPSLCRSVSGEGDVMIHKDSGGGGGGVLLRPGFPPVHLQLAGLPLGGCRMEKWQNKKPNWQVFFFSLPLVLPEH